MTVAGWAQLGVHGLALAISTPLLGRDLHRVYFSQRALDDRVFLPVERAVFRACGIDPGATPW